MNKALHTIATGTKLVFQHIGFWFTHRRVCAWCEPKRYIGGNPLAKRHTDGMCPACLERIRMGVTR